MARSPFVRWGPEETRCEGPQRRCRLSRPLTLIVLLFLLLPAPAEAAGYIVRPGDTLSTIATRSGTSVGALARANGITNFNLVRVGTYLVLPPSARAAIPTSAFSYRVRWGDTLSGVAMRFGTTLSALRALNPTLGPYLLAGTWIRVSGTQASSYGGAAASSTGGARYLVRPGDTLSGIATRFGVSLAALAAANGLKDWSHILIGTWLAIPGGSVQAGAAPYGTDARWLIASWARFYGIPASLPLAVAWQESGFNQSALSPTGAVGVMQVEPYTATIISRYLGRPLALWSLRDNIQAGVFWLTHLMAYYGGNQGLAIAAYYQGTRALARHGYYADTLRYVANVQALQSRFAG